MNVLVINCGSSSLKFQLINAETEKVLAKGLCERTARTSGGIFRTLAAEYGTSDCGRCRYIC